MSTPRSKKKKGSALAKRAALKRGDESEESQSDREFTWSKSSMSESNRATFSRPQRDRIAEQEEDMNQNSHRLRLDLGMQQYSDEDNDKNGYENTDPDDHISNSDNSIVEQNRINRYPVDANVHIREPDPEKISEDSDESISLSAAGKREDRAPSYGTLERLKSLNFQQNHDEQRDSWESDEYASSSKQEDKQLSGSKRNHDYQSSGSDQDLHSRRKRLSGYEPDGRFQIEERMHVDSDFAYKKSQEINSDAIPPKSSHISLVDAYAAALKDSEGHDSEMSTSFGLNRTNLISNADYEVDHGEEEHDKLGDIRSFGPIRSDGSPASSSQRVSMTSSVRNSVQSLLEGNTSMRVSGHLDTLSEKSFMSTGGLSQISTRDAKKRSYLVGAVSTGASLLGKAELERHFPDRKMKIFICTWNMAEMKTTPESLDDFVLPDVLDYVADMYIFGTQEAVVNRKEWEIKIQETLGPSFVLFHSGAHGTLHLLTFLRRDLIWFCSVSEEDNVTTRPGPSGIKTKGAVGLSFTFFGTSILFINSHFTAHDGKVNERVADFNKICSGISLPRLVKPKQSYGSAEDATSRFDCVFWMGDLNFRIGHERSKVIDAIEGITREILPNFEELLLHDELLKARNEGLIFQNFEEARIKFKPTYKYMIGHAEDKYDEKKLRIPSYTDRVLFCSKRKNGIQCLHYNSIQERKDSDHKPVFGVYEVQIRPGLDTIPLSGGQFDQQVWLEGARRRASKFGTLRNEKTSSVCNVQ